ncbi:MAG: HAD-IA family hydrolase [Candidatus Lokiarchaeota archaeon]
MINPNKIILSFDLDYTIINNEQGIINSFNYALEKYNIKPLETTEIEKLIGIPLHLMFKKVTNKDPFKLSKAFREYYSNKGINELVFISGAKEKLINLKKEGYNLGIITSKNQKLAIKLLKNQGIFQYFKYVLGETEERKQKVDKSIKKFFQNNFPDKKVIIIGDHIKDRNLAEYLGVPFIGVLTGNHNEQDLKKGITINYQIIDSIVKINKELIYSLFNQKNF